MQLTTVTLTGADDSIRPQELFEISHDFPFVEWGLLLSRRSIGNPRFPSYKWLARLQDLEADNFTVDMQYSGHLCGEYVREVLLGEHSFTKNELPDGVWDMLDRVQINTHGQPHAFNAPKLVDALNEYPNKRFIFQLDGVNDAILSSVDGGPECCGLFDLSHGAGVLPAEWPKPRMDVRCGYAGGLSPQNIEQQLQKLDQLVGLNTPIWVDMETSLRSADGGNRFDLDKCREVLKICASFM